MILVFRVFTNINLTTDFCTLCKRVSRFSVKIVLSHNTNKLRRATLWCFRKFLVSKNFLLQRVMSRFSLEIFLSRSAENFRRGIFYSCINLGYRKNWRRGGGGYQDFTSKIFCLNVPKIFVGESFTVASISGTEKVWIKRGVYQNFPSKIFCLIVPKISVGESFTVALISGIEKVWIRGGGECQDFLSKTFCLPVPKISPGQSFIVAIISGTEKV